MEFEFRTINFAKSTDMDFYFGPGLRIWTLDFLLGQAERGVLGLGQVDEPAEGAFWTWREKRGDMDFGLKSATKV